MRTLITVRHGERESNFLSQTGRRQMDEFVGKIAHLFPDQKAYILSSNDLVAARSANVIAKACGAEVETCPELLSSERQQPNLVGLLELVDDRCDLADVLILVTHVEVVDRFPAYYADQRLKAPLASGEIGYGRAWLIKTDAKTIELL